MSIYISYARQITRIILRRKKAAQVRFDFDKIVVSVSLPFPTFVPVCDAYAA